MKQSEQYILSFFDSSQGLNSALITLTNLKKNTNLIWTPFKIPINLFITGLKNSNIFFWKNQKYITLSNHYLNYGYVFSNFLIENYFRIHLNYF
jgi:hypothetical protein